MLSVAGPDPTKNVGTLGEAFARLPTPERAAHDVVLAGDFRRRADLRKRVSDLDLEKQTFFPARAGIGKSAGFQPEPSQSGGAMKGVVLAGGLGSRLLPLTKVTNKHLLPVYDRPMIYYPIQTLVNAGIREIMLVTGGNNAGDFLKLLGNGKEFGLRHLDYTYQQGEGGIADALRLAEYFADGEPVCVVLGDNLIERNIRASADAFRAQKTGAKILLKKVKDPQRFGVPVLKGKRVVKIEEKPKNPRSPYAVTGLYFYDARVFEIIKTLKPSRRGELEITDVNNAYIADGSLTWDVLDGWWTDAGTIASLHLANRLVASTGANKRGNSEIR